MQLELSYGDTNELSLGDLGRLLADIQGVVCLAGGLSEPDRLKVIFDRYFGTGDSIYGSARYAFLLNLDRSLGVSSEVRSFTFHSPPKITISITASFSVEKVIAQIVDIIKFLINNKEHRAALRISNELARQKVVEAAIRNSAQFAELVGNLRDEGSKDLAAGLVVDLIQPLIIESGGYPALREISLKR